MTIPQWFCVAYVLAWAVTMILSLRVAKQRDEYHRILHRLLDRRDQDWDRMIALVARVEQKVGPR